MKKLLTLFWAIALAVCCMGLVACGKDAGATDTKYYLYDSETESYDYDNYIDISGDKCVVGIKDDDGGKALTLDGTFEKKEDNTFSIECSYKIKSLSDILTDKDIDELKEDLGLKNFEVEFDAQVTFSASGKMYNNTLKVTKSGAKISGFKGLLAGLNGTMSDSSNDIFCQKGSKPDYSVTITFDLKGGNIGGKETVTVRTDRDGGIVFPSETPVRDGYEFIGYSWWPDFYHEVVEGAKQDEDRTLYVSWKKICTVTYEINSTEYKINGESVYHILEGNEDYPYPEIIKTVANPTTRFMGWFIGDKQIVVGSYRIDFDDRVRGDCTLTARWYTKEQVDDYNNSLDWGTNDYLYVHVISQNTVDNAKYYFYNSDAYICRVEDSGIERKYRIRFSEGSSIRDYSGYVFAFNLSNSYSDDYGKYNFLDCALRMVRYYDTNGDKNFDFTIPKSMIKSGKPTHLFYNVDTEELSYSW